MKFRLLEANEIECRVAQTFRTKTGTGLSLLLYKDARVDQNILDETVGAMNWQRHHSRDNANCTVSIWDEEKKQWIEKEDTGTESNTEKEKGLASDSFKRACFNWGIGRELYTAPFIYVDGTKCNIYEDKGKLKCKDKFVVEKIAYDDNRNIVAIVIKNATEGKWCFSMGNGNAYTKPVKKKEKSRSELTQEILQICHDKGKEVAEVLKTAKVDSLDDMSEERLQACIDWLKNFN